MSRPAPSEQRVRGDCRGGDSGGEPRVEREVRYQRRYLVRCEPVVDAAPQVRSQFVGSVEGDQCTQGCDTAVAGAQSFVGPDLVVERGIDEIGKLGCESSSGAARRRVDVGDGDAPVIRVGLRAGAGWIAGGQSVASLGMVDLRGDVLTGEVGVQERPGRRQAQV